MKVRLISGKKLTAELLEDINITTPITKININIPAGFKTDFASVPRLFWNIVPPFGEYSTAAVAHDYLYRTSLKFYPTKLTNALVIVDRYEADVIFYNLMKSAGVARWKRYIMYWAVRLFGGPSWKE